MTKACTTIVLPFSFIINIKYNIYIMFELGQKVKRLEKHQSLESTVLNIIKDGDKIIYLIHYDESNEDIGKRLR